MCNGQGCQRVLDVVQTGKRQVNLLHSQWKISWQGCSDTEAGLSFQPHIIGRESAIDIPLQPYLLHRLLALFTLYMIEHDSTTPIVETIVQFQTARTVGVEYESRWYRPIALHIHAANKMLKCGQKCLVIGEELWVFKFN